jgi:hypothetical protein
MSNPVDDVETTRPFPLPYRWFLTKGLVNLEPWSFIDDVGSLAIPPDFAKSQFFQDRFKLETGADFDVYLFARRQDMEDFAFFAVKDGQILDLVIPIHLTFSGNKDFERPLRLPEISLTFMQWIKRDVIADIEAWQSEEELGEGK